MALKWSQPQEPEELVMQQDGALSRDFADDDEEQLSPADARRMISSKMSHKHLVRGVSMKRLPIQQANDLASEPEQAALVQPQEPEELVMQQDGALSRDFANGDEEQLSPADARRMMSSKMSHMPVERGASLKIHFDGASTSELSKSVHKAIDATDKRMAAQHYAEVEKRNMVKSNCQLTLQLLLHDAAADGTSPPRSFLMDVTNSIQYLKLVEAIKVRCGSCLPTASRMSLIWLEDGRAMEVASQVDWTHFLHANWCSQPLVLHIRDSAASTSPIALTRTAEFLFLRYDVNSNGLIERKELARMMRDLKLEQLNCPTALIDRFIEGEFERLDQNGNDGVDLAEVRVEPCKPMVYGYGCGVVVAAVGSTVAAVALASEVAVTLAQRVVAPVARVPQA